MKTDANIRLFRRMCLLATAAFLLVFSPAGVLHATAVENDGRAEATSVQPNRVSSLKDETQRQVTDLQSTAQKEVAEKREVKDKGSQSDQKRKSLCENRQNAINNKLSAFTQAADKHLAKLQGALESVQAYQKTHMLPLANYDELVAAAQEKGAAADTAVKTLKAVAQNVDCTQPDTAVKLSTVRDAAKKARQALHDYRMAIKEIIVALAQAEETSNSSSGEATTRPQAEANQ